MKNSTIVVLGASGFIGKHIANKFKKENYPTKTSSRKELDLLKHSSILKLSKLLHTNTILIIASSVVREYGDTVENMLKNIKMCINISEALKLKPIQKCVFLSSCDVYENTNLPITENTTLCPRTYYAIGKITCEYILKSITQHKKIPLLILRFPGVYGPNQNIKKYGPSGFIYSILNDDFVKIWGDGEEKRDFVYVKDISSIIFELATGKISGAINLATGKNYTFMEVIKIIEKIHTKQIKIIRITRTASSFNMQFNVENLKKILPHFRFSSIEQALRETYFETASRH